MTAPRPVGRPRKVQEPPWTWHPSKKHGRGVRLDVLVSRAWTRCDRRVAAGQLELAVEALRLYQVLVAEFRLTFERQGQLWA